MFILSNPSQIKFFPKIIFTLIWLFFPVQSHSQENLRINFPSTFICSYYGEEPMLTMDILKSGKDAVSIIDNIVAVVGLKPNFEIRSAEIPNAAAVVYKNKRYVLYNPEFVEDLEKSAGNKWASVSILAHEIGHHLNGHTLTNTGSRPDIELEADEFSGFILKKMGASLSDAQSAMRIAANEKASHTHPAKTDRLKAIAKGWSNAEAQIAGKEVVPKSNTKIEKPVITKQPEKVDNDVLAEKFIAFDVKFDSDPTGKYFVTIRNNLVKVEDNNIVVAGVMADSNKKKYAAMFYDKHYNYLYITNQGQIVNGVGKAVGKISRHKSR